MNTTENNKLIAEFMLLEKNDLSCKHSELIGYKKDENDMFHLHSQLKFHSSWDWLMPVVQKIDERGYNVHISRISCKITPILEDDNVIASFVCGDVDKKIELVYDTVVAFIKWYNEQK
jgi:hypothetical protein